MITCTCGKTLDRIPSWLESVTVDFVCNNCPNKQTKSIALISLDPPLPTAAKAEDPIDVEEVSDADLPEMD